MIQRLQSVLLILAAIANFAAFFLPYGYASNNEEMDSPSAKLFGGHAEIRNLNTDLSEGKFGEWTENTISMGEDLMITVHGILLILNSVALIAMIFMFRNRARQLKLVYVGIVMLMAQVALAAGMLWTRLPDWLGVANIAESDFDMGPQFGLFIPIVAILLCWWASKRIQKDEKMVKDMDRFR